MIRFLTETPWVLQAAIIVGGFLLGILAEMVLVRTLHALAKRTKSTWDDLLVEGLHRMPIVWGTAAGLWGAMLVRDVDPYVLSILRNTLTVVIIASVTLVAMRWASGSWDQYTGRVGGGGSARLTSTTLVNNLIKLLIFVLGLFLILQNLNIEITPLITAMGIGITPQASSCSDCGRCKWPICLPGAPKSTVGRIVPWGLGGCIAVSYRARLTCCSRSNRIGPPHLYEI